MITITREWLQQTIAEFENTRDDIPFGLDDDDAKILKVLKQALASFEAEPVGEFYHEKQDGWYQISEGDKVPDNRRIPLYTAPPVPERERIRREHAEWSDKTFGDVGPIGPLKHLSKEALEAAADPSDPLEWADMQFLLWDAQRRMGISDEFITRAMIEKLAINKARQWPEPKDGEPRLHIKEQPVPAASSESVSQSLTDALRDVIVERQRQVSVKGWTPEHDDTYTCGELSGAAISYIEPMEAVFYWPAEWHDDSFKPSDERRNLVKATALLLAEIERLDRISAASALSEVSDGKARED
ncbi:DUF550 domain-containing protein [Salmonella enterica subsp. diarizonae]|nr:DUF550 domain-containing protein [Salmonella enterica subsp. diarizonae]EDS6260677.1 DUF550 domain-containing protein [Salmonella enterica subsp. diarizonae]